MELIRENFRNMIFYFSLNITAQYRSYIHDQTPCKTIIHSWFPEIKRGCVNLREGLRDGRPSTTVNRASYDRDRP